MGKVEKKLLATQVELQKVEKQFAGSEHYEEKNKDKLTELLEKHKDLKDAVAKLENKVLDLMRRME